MSTGRDARWGRPNLKRQNRNMAASVELLEERPAGEEIHVKGIAEEAGLAKSGLRREVVMLENMTSLRPPYFSPSAGKLIMVATSVRM
jgi:hypothetical protein